MKYARHSCCGLIIITMALVWSPGTCIGQNPTVFEPSSDNTLYETLDGSLSNGAGQHLFAGRTSQASGSKRRAVVYFNITFLNFPDPDCPLMFTSASVTLHVSQANPEPRSVSLHRLLKPWGEGTSDAIGGEGSGAVSTPDDATWVHQYYDTLAWETPGGDFVGAASATVLAADTGYYTWTSNPSLVADIVHWRDHPDSNFGWIVIGDESAPATAKSFDSRNHPDASVRPQLSVDWVLEDCCVCDHQGDLDGNGVVDSADLNYIIGVMFFNWEDVQDLWCPITRSNINGDAWVDGTDLNPMINYLFFNGPAPCNPCGFPGCP